ncbi:WxL domain-containing protein [Lacticaseibacillus brantae]|uniref:Cell surface protein n=1 Tax=Lacticaseibacillus brantae DSM 23927 TaxID=1423727 RepID=A0A0R2AVJ5_9LACO|nr:WxL domain-containing protein [Lacticaseibacillus brantae]KRM71261.1 cell surface protein [Lacticaseibacillus brantae DSM 23927]
MKNISKFLLSAVVLSAVAFTPKTIFAADDPIEYHSHGQVEFTPSTDPTDPTDPIEPGNPVQPIDPTDPTNPVDPGTPGPLSIDFASSFDFGKQAISSSDKVYTAAAQAYYKLGADGKPTGDLVYGPDYVQVTDNRGTLAGWTLTVTQDGQFISDSKHVLDGAVVTLKDGNVVTASSSDNKPTPAKDTALTPGTASLVMSATNGQGGGTFLNDWGTKSELTSEDQPHTNSVTLSVPGRTTKYAETYKTTLTWNLSDVPGNGTTE